MAMDIKFYLFFWIRNILTMKSPMFPLLSGKLIWAPVHSESKPWPIWADERHEAFHSHGGTPKWLVYFRENTTKIRMITGGSPISGNTQISPNNTTTIHSWPAVYGLAAPASEQRSTWDLVLHPAKIPAAKYPNFVQHHSEWCFTINFFRTLLEQPNHETHIIWANVCQCDKPNSNETGHCITQSCF